MSKRTSTRDALIIGPSTSITATTVTTTTAALVVLGVAVGRRFWRFYQRQVAVGRDPVTLLSTLLYLPWVRPLCIPATSQTAETQRDDSNDDSSAKPEIDDSDNKQKNNDTKESTSTNITKEALVVILPDPGIHADNYVSLSKALQAKAQEYKIQLHVGIIRGIGGERLFMARCQANSSGLVQASIFSLWKRFPRVENSDTFIFMHGKHQGLEAIILPHRGFIRLGCPIDEGIASSLASFPKPCLTMLGDQDRDTCYLHASQLLQEVPQSTINTNSVIPIPKPILVLSGVTHENAVVDVDTDVTTKISTKGVHNWPNRTVSHNIAVDQVACVSTNFMRIVLQGSPSEMEELANQLSTGTQKRLESYQQLVTASSPLPLTKQIVTILQRIQQRIYHHVTHPEEEQHIHSSPGKLPFDIGIHQATTLLDLVYSKPEIITGTKHDSKAAETPAVRMILYAQPNGVRWEGCNSKNNKKNMAALFGKTSYCWAVKCKSQAMLRQCFPYLDQERRHNEEENHEDSVEVADECRENVFQTINQEIFDYVLDHCVTPLEKRRYIEATSPSSSSIRVPRLIMGPDLVQASSVAWIHSQVVVVVETINATDTDVATTAFVVRSPVAYTPSSDRIPSKFRGMHYGKVLSPAFCYEWIVWTCWMLQHDA